MEEQYALSWMSFKNNLISGYQELYRDEMFTDVTLAADGVIAKCHRAVLAISSDFFKIMLESCTGNNHPIIYLNNISQQNLKNLLEFIYYGETRVEHADLSQFILNAESLQIKGLTGPKTAPTKQTRSIKRKASQSLENEIKSPKMIEVIEPEFMNEEDLEHIKAAEEHNENLLKRETCQDIEEEIEPSYIQTNEMKVDENPDNSSYIPDYENTDDDYIEDDYDMGFPQDGDEIKFIRSQKLNAQLVYNMCIYNRKKTLQNGCTTWRCCENLKYKCKAVCITLNDKFVNARHRHNHPNHWEKIANRPLHDRSEFELNDLIDELEAN
ncbi:modifier of mdg4-like [Ctenocephalides felis]|uniref:modifier of mdg4-like n=1 Tax=Ctenocephalides felis TaxID=7515 RepID=UPI000E6E5573|nr:modifier of mdg4-like [Ctenocephalides felis]XP_026462068.1 modifier of mdg4-like [Ctenocephalides felis]